MANSRFWAMYYTESGDKSDAVLCEVDGGICYECSRTLATMQRRLARFLATGKPHWRAQYFLARVPVGTLVWDSCRAIIAK